MCVRAFVCVCVRLAICEEETRRSERVRQRADREEGRREERGAGGGLLPEAECWNIEHAVLI